MACLAAAAYLNWPNAHAAQAPLSRLENFDNREAAAAAAGGNVARATTIAEAELDDTDARIDVDPITGSPTSIGSWRGFLSSPPPTLAGQTQAAVSTGQSESYLMVKAFMDEHEQVFGYGGDVLDSTVLKREYVTEHSGMKSTIWQQQLDGIPVFEGYVRVNFTASGELINIGSNLIGNITQAADRGMQNRKARQRNPFILARKAVVKAAANLGEAVTFAQVRPMGRPVGPEKVQQFSVRGFNEASAQLVYLPHDENSVKLCWQIHLVSKTRGEMFSTLIDASNGQPELRHCLTEYISNASYRVFTSDSPSPFSPGHSVPSSSQPALVERELVTISALSPVASPKGWIDDGVTETRGNNVNAHTDSNGDDRADLPLPQGGAGRIFDFPLDLNQPPVASKNAAIVQLFYWCNFVHDRLYELGFTEAAGNFQIDNFGRGGRDRDAIEADAQDGSGVNNANFSTPPDGRAGRMQMYVFTAPTPDRDGDLDAEIILHEYTHGLSNRLVGGGVGIRKLQSMGLGEGWSDFYALALLSKPEDQLNGNYAMGGYATRQLAGLDANYYFGIRRYPYSTNLGSNPLTFADIDPHQAKEHAGVPMSPIFVGSGADEVHNMGEVWCVALWEARGNLIAKLGFAAGNRTTLQLVTDGMKLAPANPNFLQARDAIIQADLVLSGGAHRNELWAAFAKRGMGVSARSPDSSRVSGIVEAFDVPAATLPAAPGALSIYMTSAGGVRVEWADNSSDETGFEVERSNNGSTFSFLVAAPANSDVAARIVDSAVSPGQRYFYRVRAVKSTLYSEYSPAGSIDVPPQIPSPYAPGALSIYMTSAGGVRVEWADNSSDETGFEIERSGNGSTFSFLVVAPANPDAAARIVDSAISPGQRYFYRVRAVKGSLYSGYSPVGSIDVAVVQPPTAPGSLRIYMTSEGGARVEWADNSSDETGFEIERSGNGSTFSFLVAAPANPDAAARIVDHSVAAGRRYYYRVRAAKGSLYSGYSPIGSIQVPAR